MVANQLHELGYRDLHAANLKPKHVEALISRWKDGGLSAGTIKNRMTALRWWAEKVARQNVIARANGDYGIARRQYVTNVSQARELTSADLAKVSDPYTARSLELQAVFGLRREESIKIVPSWADGGDRLFLKASWTKGGREREIPIRTPEQRAVLEAAKLLAGTGSLIPRSMKYIGQLNRFKDQCAKAGIEHVHGHRHHYAQVRYQTLTGWPCPSRGGPTARELSPEQRELDRAARIAISDELGHGRGQVTAVYLGR
jgi:site-specific recombinase XerC